jgi:hypothetical protein
MSVPRSRSSASYPLTGTYQLTLCTHLVRFSGQRLAFFQLETQEEEGKERPRLKTSPFLHRSLPPYRGIPIVRKTSHEVSSVCRAFSRVPIAIISYLFVRPIVRTDRVLLVFLLHDLFFARPACHDVSETLFMIFSLLSRVLEPRWAASAWSRLKRSDRDNLKQDGAVQGIEYLSAVGYPSTAICCSQPSVQRAASQLAGFHTKTGLKEVRNISKIESRDRFS